MVCESRLESESEILTRDSGVSRRGFPCGDYRRTGGRSLLVKSVNQEYWYWMEAQRRAPTEQSAKGHLQDQAHSDRGAGVLQRFLQH